MSLKSQVLGLLVVIVLPAIILGLGLNGPFLLDDYSNLIELSYYGGVQDVDSAMRYLFGMDGGKWQRSFARLTFLINDQTWPSVSYDFKKTNIALHIVNALLLLLLMIRIQRYHRVFEYQSAVFLVPLLWVLSPLNVSTVLYVVQRMTELSCLFVLLSLLFYCLARQARNTIGSCLALCGSALCFLFGMLSKENAIVVLLLVPILEFGVFSFSKRDNVSYVYKWLAGLSAVVFVLIFSYVTVMKLPGYNGRVFYLFDRLQIQGLVLCKYLYYQFGFDYLGMSLHHDDIEWLYRKGELPRVWLWWLPHCLLLMLAISVRKKVPLAFVGVTWFYACHILESSTLPLELMFEHRNYLPSIGVIVAFVALLVKFLVWVKTVRKIDLLMPVTGMLLGLSTIGLIHRSLIWSNEMLMSAKWAAEHPYSLRAQVEYATSFVKINMLLQAKLNYDAMIDKFDEPSLRINRLMLECELDIETSTLSVGEMVGKPFSSGMLSALKSVVKKYPDDCLDGAFSPSIDELIMEIDSMPLLEQKKGYLAGIYDVQSSFYKKTGDFTKAAYALERLYQVQPSVATALKAAEHQLKGGNLEFASEYVAFAESIEEGLFYSDQRYKSDIARLKALIKINEGG